MTPSILRHIFARPNFLVQNSLFHMTTALNNVTFRISVLSYKEVVIVRIAFLYVMYILNAYIFTWELLGNFTYHWELYED